MRICAGKSPTATVRHSSFRSSGIKPARSGSPVRSSKTNPTRATFRRTPSSNFMSPRAVSMDVRGSLPGFTGCWLIYASTVADAIDGGGESSRYRVRATIPMRPRFHPASPDAGPEVAAMQGQAAGLLGDALNRLSPNQRIAVLLQAQEGLSSREIAEVLSVPRARRGSISIADWRSLKRC